MMTLSIWWSRGDPLRLRPGRRTGSGGEGAGEDLPGQGRLRGQAEEDVNPLAEQVLLPAATGAVLQPLVEREHVEQGEQRHQDPVAEPARGSRGRRVW